MRMTRLILVVFCLFFCVNSHALLGSNPVTKVNFHPLQIEPNNIERIAGKKLTLFENLKLKPVHGLFKKKYTDGEITATQKKQANASAIPGVSSMLLLLLAPTPLAYFDSFGPAALIAVILGTGSRKGNCNKKGLFNAVTAAITLSITVIFSVLIILMYSGGGIE